MKRTIIFLAALLAGQMLCAQNLNPQVQVTNEYETRLSDVNKQGPEMAVPDSLHNFDYHFDYSVFDSPYKGSYEFSPYSVTITPDPSKYDGRKLYLNAGAGYTFRPELDLVWSAVDTKKLALNVFANGEGFRGRYRDIVPSTFELYKEAFHKGYDFDAAAGVDLRVRLGRVNLRAETGYEGIYTDHAKFSYTAAHSPYGRVSFNMDPGRMFSVNGGVQYRYVKDIMAGRSDVDDHEVTVDATVSVRPAKEYRVSSDFLFAWNSYYWGFGIHPHLLFQLGVFDVDAGARIGKAGEHFTLSPDITATVHLLNDYLQLFAGAVGQNHYTTYWDYKTNIHHYFWYDYGSPRPIREVADLFLGVDGHADFGLQYDVRVGYRFLKDAPLWAVSPSGLETLYFLDCDMFHADLAVSWASRRLNLDGAFHLTTIPQGVPGRVFEPALLTGTFKATYNWMERIYAGVSLDVASNRKAIVDGYTRIVPGYANLGIRAEYRLNKRLGVWVKGINILNQEVRISPLYSEYGPSVVAGVTFNL